VVQCLIDLLLDKYRRNLKLDSDLCFHVAVRPFAALLPNFLCLADIYQLQEYSSVSYKEAREICSDSLRNLKNIIAPALIALRELDLFVEKNWVACDWATSIKKKHARRVKYVSN
jgi:hypothetical protein